MKNNSYEIFSEYYDIYTSLIDYELWAEYLYKLAGKDLKNKNILDLGCGSGNMLLNIKDIVNANLYGVDISEDMLSIADYYAYYENKQINLIKSDMTKFRCDMKFDFIYSSCDSVNYILNEKDFKRLLTNVYEMLNEDSVFTFDIINNNYIEKDDYLSFEDIEFKIRRKKENNFLYTTIKIVENHKQKAEINHKQRLYSIEEIEKIVSKTKFEEFKYYDFLSEKEIHEKSDKIQIILKKY